MVDLKAEARQLLDRTLEEVDVRLAVARNLKIEGSHLHAAGGSFNLKELRKVLIIAIGKAATPMYETAIGALGALPRNLAAIVVSPQPPRKQHGTLLFFHGSHPAPDESSRTAATSILKLLGTADTDTLVLFLISGGSSSMVELPLDPDIPNTDIAEFNRVLVGSGMAISEINVLRKHLSAVKGGRLAAAASPAAQCSLIVSDVPAGSLDMVGSGPSIPDSSSRELCGEIYRRLRSTHVLPRSVERFFDRGLPSDPVKPGDPCFRHAVWASILSSDDLARTAAAIASRAGFHVEHDDTCDGWSSANAARYLLDRSKRLHMRSGRTCLISVGEVSVALNASSGNAFSDQNSSGQGGRNQHFVLQCAIDLSGCDLATSVLSAGSDGIDGNSPAAGAIADPGTCDRALAHGIDPLEVLASFDSFRLFHALGDAIVIGPTGNNLRDLRLLIA